MTTTQPIAAPRPGTGVDRRLVLMGAGIVVVVLVALAVVAVVGGRPAQYATGTPEAAFQSLLQASDAGDTETAYAALSPRVRGLWTYDDYAMQAPMYRNTGERLNVYIDRTLVEGDRATLGLTVEHVYGEGLTASRWTEPNVQVRLVRVDGTWYVDAPLAGTQWIYR
jgi:hypothetical protein